MQGGAEKHNWEGATEQDISWERYATGANEITQEKVQKWIVTCTQKDESVWNSTQCLLKSFASHVRLPVIGSSLFGKRLSELHFESVKRYVKQKQERGFVGIRIKNVSGARGGNYDISKKRRRLHQDRQNRKRHLGGDLELKERSAYGHTCPCKEMERKGKEASERHIPDVNESTQEAWRANINGPKRALEESEATAAAWRSKQGALERALKESQEAAARNSAEYEEALERAWEALADGEKREEVQRFRIEGLEESLKKARVKGQEQEATWLWKTSTLEENLKVAQEVASQAEAGKEKAVEDKVASDVAWGARTSAFKRAVDEAQGALSESLAREEAWRSRSGTLERALEVARGAAVRASNTGHEREAFWKSRFERIEKELAESRAKEDVLRKEKESVEEDLLAYTLCGMRGVSS